jgi:hypothetical protein
MLCLRAGDHLLSPAPLSQLGKGSPRPINIHLSPQAIQYDRKDSADHYKAAEPTLRFSYDPRQQANGGPLHQYPQQDIYLRAAGYTGSSTPGPRSPPVPPNLPQPGSFQRSNMGSRPGSMQMPRPPAPPNLPLPGSTSLSASFSVPVQMTLISSQPPSLAPSRQGSAPPMQPSMMMHPTVYAATPRPYPYGVPMALGYPLL